VTPHSFFRVEVTKTADTFEFEVKYRDRDQETNLSTANLMINGINYTLIGGKLSLPFATVSQLETVVLTYQVVNSLGTKTIVIHNPDSISLRFLDEMLAIHRRLTKDLFQ
jgi:hypothetical protein